jgi:DNA-binding protein H-NS
MATTVHEGEELVLMDGTKIKVRSLKISLLRPFMKKFEQVAGVAEDNDKSMTLLIECVQIAMEQYNPDLSKDISKLEEVLDLPTVYKIIEAASGVKLADANALLNTVLANN